MIRLEKTKGEKVSNALLSFINKQQLNELNNNNNNSNRNMKKEQKKK